MLLSLESPINTGVLTVKAVGTKPKQRIGRAVAVRSGSENISKADKGSTGTRESLTSPHVKGAAYGQPREQETGLCRELVAPAVTVRISNER